MGTGAAIGFTPQQVMDMSIWQFNKAVEGYIKANSSKEDKKFASKEEEDSIFDFMLNGFGIKTKTTLKNNVWLWDGTDFKIVKTVQFESEQ